MIYNSKYQYIPIDIHITEYYLNDDIDVFGSPLYSDNKDGYYTSFNYEINATLSSTGKVENFHFHFAFDKLINDAKKNLNVKYLTVLYYKDKITQFLVSEKPFTLHYEHSKFIE